MNFNFEARTSRGSMKQRWSYFLKVWDSERPDAFGLGECAPLAGLSIETPGEAEAELRQWAERVASINLPLGQVSLFELHSLLHTHKMLPQSSSVTLAVEMALLDLLNGGKRIIFENEFVKGIPIAINGLIWMGGLDYMLQQIDIKIRDGFSCIKMKVGSYNFEKECDILQYIRRKYYKQDIVIRLDANGAFKEDALDKLRSLARFNVHSIEQPVVPSSDKMASLCRDSPVAIALDEELIKVTPSNREELLKRLRPQHIILKPSLMGGFKGSAEWIDLAQKMNIGWWLTSALESNVGLNAIAQFASQYPLSTTQGLGTGSLYTNNVVSPLCVAAGKLTFDLEGEWDLQHLFATNEREEPTVSEA